MKILGLTPHNKFTGDTPEELQLKKLRDFGHTVYIMDSCNKLPDKDIDVIAAMSEVSTKNACILSSYFGIPYYAHMEWLPEWRIFKDNESNWGFFTKIPYKAKMDFIRLYQQYSYYWKIANVKTLAAQCFKNTMLEFIGLETNIQTKPVGIDTERIKEELRSDVKKEDAIVCISRFTPHKRITHIIKALNMINYKGTLKLVGYGEEQMNYIINAGNLHIEFLPSEKKIEALQSSKICIALWSGIVPGEAFYSGIPVITYESDYMRELYGNTLVYAKNNSPASLGAAIEAILSIPEEARDDMARYGVEKIENKKINVYTLEESARVLESLLKEAKVKYNENKD